MKRWELNAIVNAIRSIIEEVMLDVMVPDTDDVASLRLVVDNAELLFRKGRGKPVPGGYDVQKRGK